MIFDVRTRIGLALVSLLALPLLVVLLPMKGGDDAPLSATSPAVVTFVRSEANARRYGDPCDASLQWQRDGAAGAIDLDAAFGRGSNRELIARVVGKLDVAVELSGGIRDDETLAAALSTGCARVSGARVARLGARRHFGARRPSPRSVSAVAAAPRIGAGAGRRRRW